MRALFDNRKKDTSGQLLTMGRSGSSISNTLCRGPDKNGWAENSDRMPYVEYAESAVPSSRRMNQGLAFTQDGALYITGDAVTSTSNKVNGIAIRADGALHVAPAGSTATLKSNGMGITASGQVIMAESFVLPLNTSVVPLIGTGSATYTRATVATVFDNESVLRNVLSGEARFQGARRVRNLVVASEDLMNANWVVAGTGVKVSATEFSFPAINGGVTHSFTVAVGDVVSFSVTLSGSGTITLVRANFGVDLQITLTATPQRFVVSGVATSTGVGPYVYRRPADTATSATIKYMQFENVTGQSNQAPAEYVSVGVLSTPFHGAGVDGVKYFSTTNGNSVASNVVTESAGSPISASTLLGYLAEGARTNLCLYSQDISNALGWVAYAGGTATGGFADPAGGTNGVRIDMPSALDGWHTNNITVSTGTTYAASIWIRADSAGTIRFFDGNGSGFDTTLSVTTSWRPLSTAALKSAGTQTQFAIYRNDVGQLNKVYVYAAQLELGSFASTYIPTTTASVVRNADVLTYPFAGNASASVGSAYAELSTIWDSAASSADRVSLAFSASTFLLYNSGAADSTQIRSYDSTSDVVKTGLSNTFAASRKRAMSYGGVTRQVTGDGISPQSGGFDGDIGSTAIGVGCNTNGTANFMGTIRNVRIWQVQLSATQLQAVTV